MNQLHARRRLARRRQRLARVDVGFGVLGALVLLLATPGLAIAALIAFLVLALCLISLIVERRRRLRLEAPGLPLADAKAGVGERSSFKG